MRVTALMRGSFISLIVVPAFAEALFNSEAGQRQIKDRERAW
jgi:hypothetical protein